MGQVRSEGIVHDEARLTALQDALGYRFQDLEFLKRALTHRSWVEERHPGGNAPAHLSQQRLEYLGDAILNYAVARWLIEALPTALESELTNRRSAFVKGEALTGWARELGVDGLILRGRGEAAQASRNTRALEDTVEAILGAVVRDGGEAAAIAVVQRWLPDELPDVALDPIEVVERWHRARFKLDAPGPTSERRESRDAGDWFLTFQVLGVEATGRGPNKKAATRMAFAQLIEALGIEAGSR